MRIRWLEALYGFRPELDHAGVIESARHERALVAELDRIRSSPPPDPLQLASYIDQKIIDKFDRFLGEELLTLAFGRDRLDVSDLPRIAAELRMAWQDDGGERPSAGSRPSDLAF